MGLGDGLNAIYEGILFIPNPKKLLPAFLNLIPFVLLALFVQYFQLQLAETAGVMSYFVEVPSDMIASLAVSALPVFLSFVLVWFFLRAVYTELALQEAKGAPLVLVSAFGESLSNTILIAYSYLVPLVLWLVAAAAAGYLALLLKNIVVLALVSIVFLSALVAIFVLGFFIPPIVSAENKTGWAAFKGSYLLFRSHMAASLLAYAFGGVLTTLLFRFSNSIWTIPYGAVLFAFLSIFVAAATHPLPAILYGRVKKKT